LTVAASADAADPKITHSFLVLGGETFLLDDAGKAVWTYPHATRDGWVLPDGHLLLAVSKNNDFPGGAAVEVTREGKTLFTYKGTQSEVNTVQALGSDRFLVTEAGDKPRVLEVDRAGKILVETPIQAQTKDHHLQTRMTRKLSNGNYLVPQLLDRVVREYTPEGKIAWEVKTPNMPFTAIRLKDGHTVIACTHGDLVIEVDGDGKTVWQVTNDDLTGRPIKDACGAQRLPNGNTVIASYANGPGAVKLTEVTRDKKIVWTYTDQRRNGVHEFQILATDGKALDGPAMK
jgi:hypothetical protein